MIEAGAGQTPAETAVAHLLHLVSDDLPETWSGAEYWVQVYEKGRGLAFHVDKDEHAMKEHGAVVNPCLSSVLYLTGSPHDPLQAPTVVTDQKYDQDEGCMAPPNPTQSTLVFPATNAYCVFDGRLGHGVLDCGHDRRRATFLVNWWRDKPQNIHRQEGNDWNGVHDGELVSSDTRDGEHGGKVAAEKQPECTFPECVEVDAGAVEAGAMLMVRMEPQLP